MDGYELTDRGKIAIAVVIAVVLFALSTILVIKALAARPPQQPDGQGSVATDVSPPAVADTTPPEITDSPPPNGGGFNPPGAPPAVSPGFPVETPPGTSQNVPPSPGVTPEPSTTPDPAEGIGQSTVDPAGGTLSFHFSPESQHSLDNETTAMLGAFLGSPKNTRDTYVVIEIPQLSDEHTERLVAAIVSAFAAQGVGDQRLSFARKPTETAAGAFEVSIYYLAQQGK